ncbi:hypothetical protein LguiA_012339 [Lonicera macranthoides]
MEAVSSLHTPSNADMAVNYGDVADEGLWILAEGRITGEIAVAQLRTMIPCIVLAGPVGLGFGYMRQMMEWWYQSAEERIPLPPDKTTYSLCSQNLCMRSNWNFKSSSRCLELHGSNVK